MKGYGNALIQTAEQIVPKDFEQYTDRYGTIAWRSLVIWGRQDPALPLWSGVKLSRALADAELAIIDQCGHNTQEEQPAVAADRILQFLQKEDKESE
jgi:pimeloyl-ACP methyl ester carboxylesterase